MYDGNRDVMGPSLLEPGRKLLVDSNSLEAGRQRLREGIKKPRYLVRRKVTFRSGH